MKSDFEWNQVASEHSNRSCHGNQFVALPPFCSFTRPLLLCFCFCQQMDLLNFEMNKKNEIIFLAASEEVDGPSANLHSSVHFTSDREESHKESHRNLVRSIRLCKWVGNLVRKCCNQIYIRRAPPKNPELIFKDLVRLVQLCKLVGDLATLDP